MASPRSHGVRRLVLQICTVQYPVNAHAFRARFLIYFPDYRVVRIVLIILLLLLSYMYISSQRLFLQLHSTLLYSASVSNVHLTLEGARLTFPSVASDSALRLRAVPEGGSLTGRESRQACGRELDVVAGAGLAFSDHGRGDGFLGGWVRHVDGCGAG